MKKVIGMDLGDKRHVVVVFDEQGEERGAEVITNTRVSVSKWFARHPGAVVVMEAGTHSPWISRLLESAGHEVYVGNPRKLRAIWDADDKSDQRDARILGLMYRMEPRLLHRIFHRGEVAQVELERIKTRNMLVGVRTDLINHARGAVKAMGYRITACSSSSFHHKAVGDIPEVLRAALNPLIETIESLTEQIKSIEQKIAEVIDRDYPEAGRFMQIPGVGPITSLAYVLTLESPERFKKSRQVGSFLGMTPRRDQSGSIDKQLPITKAGNTYLRSLLVNAAHYILGPFGPESDVRDAGLRIAARGGKNAKKRAVVAVARKLSTVMHRMWMDQADYIASKNSNEVAA